MVNGKEYDIYPKVGTPMMCPVCGKQFKASDDTRYIRAGGYTCSWKCFLAPKRDDEGKITNIDALITKEIGIETENTVKPENKLTKKSSSADKPKPETKSKTKSDSTTRKITKKDETKTKSTPVPKVVELF